MSATLCGGICRDGICCHKILCRRALPIARGSGILRHKILRAVTGNRILGRVIRRAVASCRILPCAGILRIFLRERGCRAVLCKIYRAASTRALDIFAAFLKRNFLEKTASRARVAGGSAALLDFKQQRIVVAVQKGGFYELNVTAALAFFPDAPLAA